MLKLKMMMLCVMMLPLVVVIAIAGLIQSVRATTASAWIMRPPDWQTPLNGIISPQREADLLCKNNWKNPEVYMSRQIELPLSMATHAIIVSNTYALPANYKCLNNKTEQSIYECLLGFCFNNIFCAATNFGCIDSFLLPNSRNEEMMGDGFRCYCCRFVLNSKRLLSTSCNKQGQRSSGSIFFMVLFPMLEVRRIVCVEKLNKP